MMDDLIALKAVVKPSELVKAALERSGYLTDLANDDTNEARMRDRKLEGIGQLGRGL